MINQRQIATGVMTDRVQSSSSWIKISDPELANKIRIGHMAKIEFEKSMMEKMKSGYDDFQQMI